ncbi:hypothetical protein [Salibacterium sp. K-3]
MQHIQYAEKLQSLLKIEKAIGNAEKVLGSPEQRPPAARPEQAVTEAKKQLDQAWSHHLTKRW